MQDRQRSGSTLERVVYELLADSEAQLSRQKASISRKSGSAFSADDGRARA